MCICKKDILRGFFNSYWINMNERMNMNIQEPIDANSCLSTLKYSEYSENWCVQTLCSEIPIYVLSQKSV